MQADSKSYLLAGLGERSCFYFASEIIIFAPKPNCILPASEL